MVGGLLQASGCIITTDDDPVDSGGLLEVTWPVAICATTASETATVYSMNTTTQELLMDAYPCAAGTTGGTSDPILLPLGNYDVWVQVQNDAMTRSHAISEASAADFTFDGESILVVTDPVASEMGYFEVEWTIIDSAEAPKTCADVPPAGASGARIVTTLGNTTLGEANIFTCEGNKGTSVAMPAGLYTVVVELLNGADESVNQIESFEETVIGNYTIHLGIFDFILPI